MDIRGKRARKAQKHHRATWTQANLTVLPQKKLVAIFDEAWANGKDLDDVLRRAGRGLQRVYAGGAI